MIEFDNYYTKLTKEIKRHINSEEDDLIALVDIKELIEYFCTDRALTPIQVDGSREITSNFITRKHPMNVQELKATIETNFDLESERLILEIPILVQSSNSIVSKLYPYIDDEKSIKLHIDHISIQIIIKERSYKKDANVIDAEKKEKMNTVFNWLKESQQHMAGLSQHFIIDIKHFIGQRKEKILATQERHNEILRTINIPLKRKKDTIANKIQLDNTPLVKRIRPTFEVKEEYQLDRQKALDIIQVMDNQGRQFEKTPLTYQKLGEDDLRNILLVNLNSIFEGKAVGEAFSHMGKTDITLNIDKGNILIIECKIWNGTKKHNEAVTQLISYLTWRNNYGIVINFCRNKDMSKIIRAASEEIKMNPTFSRKDKIIHETHFSTVHQSPSDSEKLIEIHHVFYNLFTAGDKSRNQ